MINVSSEQILTLTGAAEHLRCSVKTIRKMQANGLEVFRVGNRIRTSKEALDRYFHGPNTRARSRGMTHADLVRELQEQSCVTFS